MSIDNKALRHLNSDAASIRENDKVLDYRLSDKEQPQQRLSQYIILFLLIASITLYFIDPFKQPASIKPLTETTPVQLDSILVNYHYDSFLNNAELESTDTDIAQPILNFLRASYSDIEGQEKKVVLYEIIDYEKDKQLVNVLLDEADSLFKIDRLTAPKGNNAFEKYEAVLILEKDNPDALAGIKKIVDRYVFLAEKVVRKKEFYKVPGLVRSAHKVGHKYMDMRPMVAKYNRYIDDETVFIELPTEPTAAGTDDNIAKAKYESDQAVNKSQNSAAVLPVVEADHGVALTAWRLLNRGDKATATTILERFAVISDYWGKSYDLLLQLYLQENKIKQAEELVNRNSTLDLFTMAEKVARIFASTGDIDGALNLLASHKPDIDNYRHFYDLQAALYFKNSDYANAIEAYKALLRHDHADARYWLGLAVSLDAIGDESRVKAFRQADHYAAADSSVQHYINQHILTLSY